MYPPGDPGVSARCVQRLLKVYPPLPSFRYSIFDIRYSIFDIRCSIFDIRYSMFDLLLVSLCLSSPLHTCLRVSLCLSVPLCPTHKFCAKGDTKCTPPGDPGVSARCVQRLLKVYPPPPQFSIFDIRYSIFDIRYSIFDIRYSTFNVRYSTFDLQCSIFDLRSLTFRPFGLLTLKLFNFCLHFRFRFPSPTSEAQAQSIGPTPTLGCCQHRLKPDATSAQHRSGHRQSSQGSCCCCCRCRRRRTSVDDILL